MSSDAPGAAGDRHGSSFEPDNGAKGRLVAASAATFAASAVTLGVGIMRAKFTAVLLGTAGVGLLANLGIYNALAVGIGSAAAGQGAMRAMAAAHARNERERLAWLTSWVLAVPAAIGVILFLGTVLAAPVLAERVTGSAESATMLAVSALAIPLGLAAGSYALIWQTFQRVTALARVSVATTVISAVAAIGLTFAFGVPGAVVGLVALPAVRLLLLLRDDVSPMRRRWQLPPREDLHLLKPILSLGLTSVVVATSGALAMLIIRSSVVRELGLQANGVYQPVAAITGTYLEVFIASTAVYLFPRLTQLDATGRRDQFALELGHGMRILLSLSVPVMTIAIGFSSVVLTLLYSADFRSAEQPLAIQLAASPFKVIAWSIGAGLLPLGRYRAWAVIALITIGVQLAASILLVPTAGLNALAIGYTLAWFWSAAASIAVIARSNVLPPRREWVVAALGVFIPAATLAATGAGPVATELTAVLLSGGWVFLVRRELAEFGQILATAIRSHPLRRAGP